MGCVFSEVATWITEGNPKLLDYRHRRKQEIQRKSKSRSSEDCFHYRSEVLETVAQMHTGIMQNSRRNDFITPSVIQELVKGMIRPDPDSRASAKFFLETSANILKEAEVNLKRAIPDSPAPNPDHTVSDTSIDVRRPRLPPNLPPDRGYQVPAIPSDVGKNAPRPLQVAELHNTPPRSVRQDINPLQQGRVREYSEQKGGDLFGMHSDDFTAQNDEPYAHRPSHRIGSHPATSSVQSQQRIRSLTSTAGIAGLFPNNRPRGDLVDTYDSTNASFLPQRPRDYRTMNNDLSASRPESNDELSGFFNSQHADLANGNHTSFQNHQPTVPDTHDPSAVEPPSSQHQPPRPTMSVEEGLKIKKAKRWSHVKYPGEDIFHTTDDILKKRDHVRESRMCYLSSKLIIGLGFSHR